MSTLNTLSWMPRKPMPESEKKVTVGGRIDPKLFQELTALADADRRTVSFMVEEAVRYFLEHARTKTRSRKRQ